MLIMESLNLGTNKRADISVSLLVLMTIVLLISSIFIFITNINKVGAEVIDVKFIDEVYVRENEIDFYVNEAMTRAVKNFDQGYGKQDFIVQFKKELENYKVDGEYVLKELGDVEKQITENNIKIEDNKVSINLIIKIIDDTGEFSIAYSYQKEFKKNFEKVFK